MALSLVLRFCLRAWTRVSPRFARRTTTTNAFSTGRWVAHTDGAYRQHAARRAFARRRGCIAAIFRQPFTATAFSWTDIRYVHMDNTCTALLLRLPPHHTYTTTCHALLPHTLPTYARAAWTANTTRAAGTRLREKTSDYSYLLPHLDCTLLYGQRSCGL